MKQVCMNFDGSLIPVFFCLAIIFFVIILSIIIKKSIIDDLINLRDNYSESHKLSSYPDDTELDIPTSEWGGYCHTLVQLVIRMYDTDGCVYEVNI